VWLWWSGIQPCVQTCDSLSVVFELLSLSHASETEFPCENFKLFADCTDYIHKAGLPWRDEEDHRWKGSKCCVWWSKVDKKLVKQLKVGKDTWEKSMGCLAKRGVLVLSGNASGKVPPIDPLLLSAKGLQHLLRIFWWV
jgi:hypothetical protein